MPSLATAIELAAPRYWRPLHDWERKLDFAAMDLADAREMERSAVVLGTVVAGVMDKYLAWAGSLTSPPKVTPAFLGDEFGAEMARVMARGYVDGIRDYERAAERAGRVPSLVGLTSSAEKTITRAGMTWGERTAQSFADRVRPIIDAAWALDGRRVKEAATLKAEIATLFAGYFEPSNAAVEFAEEQASEVKPKRTPFRGRRMKVRDPKQFAKWQKSFIPYSKWIREEAPKIAAKRVALKKQHAETWLLTERVRFQAHGTIAAAQSDPDVVQLGYSAIRDGRECPACGSRDGVVRPKGDNWWALNTPPMHRRCRCSIGPIWRNERVKNTPLRTITAEVTDEGVSDGYGTYNPRKVQSAKRLGIAGPTTAKMTRAIRIAQGRGPRRTPRRTAT